MALKTDTTAPAVTAPVAPKATETQPQLVTEPTPGLKLIHGSYNVPTLNKLAADAKSVVGRIPLIRGVDETRNTSKGLAVKRLDAYNWSAIPLEAVPQAKRAVRLLLAMQSLEAVLKSAQS